MEEHLDSMEEGYEAPTFLEQAGEFGTRMKDNSVEIVADTAGTVV